jgi:cell division septation protein DedD
MQKTNQNAQSKDTHPLPPYLKGLFTGVVAGVILSALVAAFVLLRPSPFQLHAGQVPVAPDKPVSETPEISRHGLLNPTPVDPNNPAPGLTPPAEAGAAQPAPAPEAAPVAPPIANPAAAPAKPSLKLFIQTGAFLQETEAANQRSSMALLGMEATVLSPSSLDKPALYRVRIGPFATQEEAATAMATLRSNHINGTLVRP